MKLRLVQLTDVFNLSDWGSGPGQQYLVDAAVTGHRSDAMAEVYQRILCNLLFFVGW